MHLNKRTILLHSIESGQAKEESLFGKADKRSLLPMSTLLAAGSSQDIFHRDPNF